MITIGNKEYELKLTMASGVALEKAIGKSLMAVLQDMQSAEGISLSVVAQLFHAELQPRVTFEQACDLFDEWQDSFTNKLKVCMEALSFFLTRQR